jgi:hypothetical protein
MYSYAKQTKENHPPSSWSGREVDPGSNPEGIKVGFEGPTAGRLHPLLSAESEAVSDPARGRHEADLPPPSMPQQALSLFLSLSRSEGGKKLEDLKKTKLSGAFWRCCTGQSSILLLIILGNKEEVRDRR